MLKLQVGERALVERSGQMKALPGSEEGCC